MVLLIDNYDSFSYNLVQLIGKYNNDIKVIRNDEMTVEEVDKLNPECIILSPGPGKPVDAGICMDVVKKLGSKYKILGVCLGHQSICEALGGKTVYASKLMHGKKSNIKIDTDSKIYRGLEERVDVGRYHSLAVDITGLNDVFKVTGISDDNEIMSVEHKEYRIYGVQYHPESILTPCGEKIIKNFLEI